MPAALEALAEFFKQNPQVIIPAGAVVGEFIVLLAAGRTRSGLERVLAVAEITAFAAASTILAAGTLSGTFLTNRMPGVSGVASLVGYAFVIPIVWLASVIALKPAEIQALWGDPRGSAEIVMRITLGLILVVASAFYLWTSLFLAASLS